MICWGYELGEFNRSREYKRTGVKLTNFVGSLRGAAPKLNDDELVDGATLKLNDDELVDGAAVPNKDVPGGAAPPNPDPDVLDAVLLNKDVLAGAALPNPDPDVLDAVLPNKDVPDCTALPNPDPDVLDGAAPKLKADPAGGAEVKLKALCFNKSYMFHIEYVCCIFFMDG